jgi:polyisoprenoid-binding protein YceI
MTTQSNANLVDFVGTWELIPERTSVSFRTRFAWVVRAKGTLQATQGTVQVGADGRVTAEIIIDPASIDTKIQKRDDHLRSADYFDIAHHPTIAFTVHEVRSASLSNLEVVGTLDAHGRSTPLILFAEVDLAGESATLSTEVVITKGMLGMKKTTPAKSWITVHARFDRART